MKLRRLIKQNARRALQRHWSRAAAITLVALIFCFLFVTLEMLLSAVFGLPAFVDPFATPGLYIDDLPNVSPIAMGVALLVAALYFLVLVPLSLGLIRWFFLLGDGKVESTVAIFEYFRSPAQFWRALWLQICLFFRRLMWSILFLVAPVTLIYLAEIWRQKGDTDLESVLSLGLTLVGVLLLILFGVFLMIWLMRYYLAEYALVNDGDLTAREAIQKSKQLSRGRLTELLVLELSMLGWRLLDFLILPRLFTLPYRCTIKGLYAHYLIEVAKRDLNEVEETSK
ncbi:DUF975 family protein [Oscillospiraceae bacterium LTW-04]|nr:DUF975 family protein [Oscillospiraceae bacterium MB24-C1]